MLVIETTQAFQYDKAKITWRTITIINTVPRKPETSITITIPTMESKAGAKHSYVHTFSGGYDINTETRNIQITNNTTQQKVPRDYILLLQYVFKVLATRCIVYCVMKKKRYA